MLDDVIAADWRPGGDELAVVRRDRLEFPLGNTIHGRHQFRSVRIAPDGQRLALVDGASIVVIDRSGVKSTLSSGWGDRITLAWSPSGDEVWFTANRRRNDVSSWTLRAVSLSGKERVLSSSAGTGLSILDVFRDGRALIATDVARMGCLCVPPGDVQPKELAWLDGSAPRIVADSTSVFFASVDRGARVKKGQVLGYTTDLLGRKTGDVVSPIDGLVTFIRAVPSAGPRATLATVLATLPSPRPWKVPTP